MTHATAHRILLDIVAGEDSLGTIARDTAKGLSGTAPFCLWLVGPVGAGKTTISSALLHAMGLPDKVPVLSPTYTYIQEYTLPDGRRMAHMDLYRGTAIEALEDAGVFGDLSSFSGMLIEWPPLGDDAAAAANLGLAPTHIMTITPVEDGARRHYQFAVAR
ncbi:tRNA (adenosine(37)-N6)-threonylcarbamoyltransferase complex ATPase subunit type 1 TsaE [bacterium]|nr:tRNA (adenosine(37)-N6)-threonylcarbamoyltransferase complex ATPase subunit type 1 TsaE [bacterium]